MAFATPADVALEMNREAGSLTATETALFMRWLNRVEATIKARVPDLEAHVASGAIDLDLLIAVESGAVARVARNPEGLRTVTVSVDDGTATQTRDASSSDGMLRLTDDEWALLTPSVIAKAASVRMAYVPGWCGAPGTTWGSY